MIPNTSQKGDEEKLQQQYNVPTFSATGLHHTDQHTTKSSVWRLKALNQRKRDRPFSSQARQTRTLNLFVAIGRFVCRLRVWHYFERSHFADFSPFFHSISAALRYVCPYLVSHDKFNLKAAGGPRHSFCKKTTSSSFSPDETPALTHSCIKASMRDCLSMTRFTENVSGHHCRLPPPPG